MNSSNSTISEVELIFSNVKCFNSDGRLLRKLIFLKVVDVMERVSKVVKGMESISICCFSSEQVRDSITNFLKEGKSDFKKSFKLLIEHWQNSKEFKRGNESLGNPSNSIELKTIVSTFGMVALAKRFEAMNENLKSVSCWS